MALISKDDSCEDDLSPYSGIEYRPAYMYKPDAPNGVSYGDSIFDDQVIRLEADFLPYALKPLYAFLKSKNIIFVKSPKGTGKTQWLKEYLRPGSIPKYTSVLQVGHRQSLERSLAKELILRCYLDDKKPHWRYAVTVDSLELLDSTYDVLVIDEVEQVLRHLCGETIKEKRGAIFSIFVNLIRKAKQVICCDADLTGELTSHLVAKLRRNFEQDNAVAIINEPKANRHIDVYEDKYHLIADLIVDVNEGKRVYVPVGRLDLAEKLEKLLRYCRTPSGDRLHVLSLNGSTSQSDVAKDFFANPSAEAKKYDVLIATSTLSTGVSINCKHFDAVYGIFDSRPYTYQDCDQAISRVRRCDVVKVWMHEGEGRQYQSLEQAKQAPVAKEIVTRKYWLGEQAALTEAETLAVDVLSHIAFYEDEWSSDRKNKFIDMKRNDGWSISEVKRQTGLVKAGRDLMRIAVDPSGDAKYRRVLEAESLDEGDFEALNRKSEKSTNEKLAIDKYWIAHFYGLNSVAELTLAQIRDYKENNFREKAKALRLLCTNHEEAVFADQFERRDKDMLFTDFQHRTKRRDLLLGIQEASGIDPVDVLTRATRFAQIRGKLSAEVAGLKSNSRQYREAKAEFNTEMEKIRYVVGQDQIDRVADYVARNLDMVNLFLDTRFEKPTSPEAKTKVFNKTMGELGVTILKRQKTINKVKHAEYVVDFTKIAEMAAKKDMAKILRN